MRIVSICPSNTEIVHALGLTDQLVGVDRWSDWPPQVRELPDVGTDLAIDMEKVKALKPDLVLAGLTVPGMERNVQALREAKLPHLVITPERFTDFITDVYTIACALDAEAKGRELVDRYHRDIAGILEVVPERGERPPTVLEWWPKPHVVACNLSWATDMIHMAGGENVFRDVDQASRTVSEAEILERDPAVYLLCWMGTKAHLMAPERVYERPGWGKMSAVADKRVFVVPEHLLGRPGPRLIEGLARLVEVFAGIES